MLRTNPFLLLLFCVLFASPLFAEVVVDPNGFELDEVPTGLTNIEIMTLSNDGDGEVDFTINVEVDEGFMAPERDRRGGPDDWDYEWRDNLEDDGPEYEWIDIAQFDGVRNFNMGDDQTTGPYMLEWEFPYYDHASDRVWVCSDGWVSPTWGGYTRSFPNYPTNQFGDMWTHSGLDWLGGQHPCMFWTNARDLAIVTYGPNYEGQGMAHQVIINGDGMITFQYGAGWQNNNRFVQQSFVGFNAVVEGQRAGFTICPRGQGPQHLANGRAIGFGPAGAWLSWVSVEPTEGTIPGGDDFEVDVIFNTTGIEEGEYSASILIATSEDQELEVSVDMTVVGGPAIASEFQEWDFGNVYAGFEASAAIPVENIGQDELVIDEIISNNADVFYAEDAPDGGWVIGPGEELDVIIHVTPAAAGEDEGVLTLNSNAINFPEVPFPVFVNGLVRPEIFVDPMGIEVDLNTGETTEELVNIANEGGSELVIEIEHEIISEPDRDQNNRNVRRTQAQAGPRRDPLEEGMIDGMLFAVFETNSVWGWMSDGMRRDPLLNDENFIFHRGANDPAEIDFEEYDAIAFSLYNQQFMGAYNANMERLTEYVDGGGGLYFETGNSQGHRSPGGITNDQNGGSSNGTLLVSPDPNHENYSYLAEVFHASEPNFWNIGERIEGSSWLHSRYSHGQFENGVEEGTLEWFQPIASCENRPDDWGAVAYGIGGGTILTVGHPVGHCWFNWARDGGQWGSMASEILYYLATAGSPAWLAYEPTEGVLQPDEDMDVIVMLDAAGLYTGEYEADLHVLSNDPEDPDVVVGILINCQGAPDMVAEWDEDFGFPDVIDWNLAYEDLFTGGPYTIPVTVSNEGTEPLLIEDFISDHEYFTSDFEQEFEIPIGEDVEMTFTFDAPADQPEEYIACMMIVSDDPDEPEFEITLHADAMLPPVVIVEPIGIEEDMVTGEIIETLISISNDGDALLRWVSEFDIIAEPDLDQPGRSVRGIDQNVGPRRDDFGDQLGQYVWNNAGVNRYKNCAYDMDNEWMWLGTYSPNWVTALSFNDDYDEFNVEVNAFNPQGNPMDMAWYNGITYIIPWANNFLMRYDAEGNNVGNLNTPFRACGVAASMDMELMFLMDDGARNIHIFEMNDEGGFAGGEIAQINNHRQFMNNQWCRNVEWVDAHPDGPLWIHSPNALWQIGVDVDEWQATGMVQNIQNWGGNQEWGGVAHDGSNIWHGGYNRNNYIIIDDATAELTWFTHEPQEGVVESGDGIEVFIILDASGLIGGDYEGDLTLLTNDPATPEVVVSVIIHVEGAPDLVVEWDEEFGYPDVVDWNAAYIDLFTGGPYTMPLTFSNEGTEILLVEGYASDNDFFTADLDDEFELPIGESVEIMFTFDAPADQPDDYNAVITVFCDDPIEMEFDIALHAEASLPPIVVVEPIGIEEDMMTGEVIETAIAISNDGDALLRWSSDFEVISEPEFDDAGRSVRSTNDNVGPQRDEVDIDGMMFAVLQDGRAWDWLDDMMMEQDQRLTRNGDDANYVTFRNGDAWNNIEFEEYDAIVYAGSRQSGAFHNAYNQNLERFMEYLDGGGGTYTETADRNAPIRLPGGFNNDGPSAGNGTLVVSPDPDADNYSLLAEIFHESQPDHWNEGHLIRGSSFLHSSYSLGQFEQALENGTIEWWQNIATPQGQQTAGAVAYGIGNGTVLAVGHPIGFGWRNWRQVGQWGSCAAEILYYLTLMGGSNWFVHEPTEGTVEVDDGTEIFVILDAAGLLGGDYEGDLTIFTNDPATPEVVVSVIIHVTGAPDLVVEWPEEIGFPDVIDWNAAFEDLFTGGPYTIPVNFSNQGTEILLVEGFDSNHEFFTADLPDEVEIPIGESMDVDFTFNAPADLPDDYNAIITIFSDDPIEQEFEIALHAEASLPPIIQVDPMAIETEVFTGDIEDHPINVGNAGDALLRSTIEIVIIDEPGDDAINRSVRSTSPDRSVNRDRRSEPDQWDYEWRDNFDEDDGIEYEWIDIREFDGVRNFNMGDDQTTGPYMLEWEFPYYDHASDRIWVCSDGWVSPTWGGYTRSFPNYPTNQFGDMWTHSGLDWLGGQHPCMFWTNGQDEAIVTYGPNYEGQGMAHQVIINADGLIKFQYGDGWQNQNRFRDQSFVGFNAVVEGGRAGFTIVPRGQGNQFLNNGRAIGFGPDNAWLSWIAVDMDELELNPGEDTDVMVTLNAEGLLGGLYEASVNFDSNDPADPHVEVSVTMDVTGAPDILVEWPEEIGFPDIVDWNDAFQDVFSGGPYPIPVLITNMGTDDLVINDIFSEHAYFGSDFEDELVFAVGEAVEMMFIFDSEEPGDYNAVMVIDSNDPDEDLIEIALHAESSMPPVAVVDPMEIAEEMVTGEIIEPVITISNDGDALLRWEADFEVLSEPEVDAAQRNVRSINNQVGPRRDEVDLAGMQFAVLQDQTTWGWLDDVMMERDPLLTRNGEDANYVTFRNGAAWNDIEFEEYDAIVYVGNRQSGNFNNAYNQNIDRFMEYIDGGGGVYTETADRNAPIRIPGGFINDGPSNSNGTLVVSPDPDADNYSLFAEICHESQPDFWNEGERIEGSAWLHSSYQQAQFQNAFDEGTIEWFQTIAVPEGQQTAGAIAYGIGSGTVLAVGHPTGHCWSNFNQQGMWGSIASEILFYLTEMGGARWFSYEPDAGEVPPGEEDEIFTILNAEGLITGTYEGELVILTNDPASQVIVVSVVIDITGAADIEPVWEEDAGFPELADWNQAYVDVFTGVEYVIPVELSNVGTDLLIISDFASDNDYFWVPFEDDIEVEIGEAVVVDFTFAAAADDPGEFNATMTIISNDPDEEEYVIELHAEAGMPPIIDIEPLEIATEMAEASTEDHVLNVANIGGSNLRFDTDFEVTLEPERDQQSRSVRRVEQSAGPLRDDPPESRYALFQEVNPWGGDIEGLIFRPIEDLVYDRYRRADFGEIDLDEYDVVWVCHSEHDDGFNQAWNQNRERYEEFVDDGGAYYASTGTNRYNVTPIHPGGLRYTNAGSSNGRVQVQGQDPNEDNYNYLAELMEWEVNTQLRGSSLFHVHYMQNDVNNIENSEWQQTIVACESHNTPGIVVYAYGGGFCVVAGTTDGHQHRNFAQAPNWGSAGEELIYYLDFLANTLTWFTWEPTDAELAPDEDTDIVATINTEGLNDGEYEGILSFFSNDPETPVAEVMVFLTVQGMSHLTGEPIPEPLEGAMAIEFDDTYADGGETEFVVTLINLGSLEATIEEVEITGDNPNDFRTDIEDGMVVPPREEVQVTFVFAPVEAGPCAANIVLHTDAMNLEDGDMWWDVSGLGQIPPAITVDPEELQAVMLLDDDPVDEMLLIGNEEGDFRRDLEFEISIEAVEDERDDANRSMRSISPDRALNRDRRAGPDDWDYEWRDNQEDDGPEFEWIDLREFDGVRNFNMGDDQTTGPYMLEWEFPYYDHASDRIWVCSDGWVSPTWGGYTRSFPNYPTNQFGDMWTHSGLDWLGGNHPCMFWTNGQDLAIVTYGPNYEGQGMAHQVIINGDGMITFQYGDGWQNNNRFRDQSFVGFNAVVEGQRAGFTICPRGQGPQHLNRGRAIGFGPSGAWTIWVTAEPDEGTVPAGEFAEVTVTFDATELEDMTDYHAILTVTSNDPGNPDVDIPVTLLTGAREEEQELLLEEGWNMVSLRVDPVDLYAEDEDRGPDVELMFAQLEDDEGNQPIQLLKDEDGRFWAPAWGFNNIPFWNLAEGYQVNVNSDQIAVFVGAPIPADADIPLEPAWNLMAYFPDYNLDASRPNFYVLSPIIDMVILAKDNDGRFMAPRFEFSNMLPWTPGQGYQVNIDSEEEIVFNYPPEQEEEVAFARTGDSPESHWTAPVSTGSNMSVLINSISGIQLEEGDQIAAFGASGFLGSSDITDQCGLAVWGDDESTKAVDGAISGEEISFLIWDADLEIERDVATDLVTYQTNGFVVLDVSVAAEIPNDFYLSQNYPNPFNNVTKLVFGMPEAGDVSIKVFDLNGRLVTDLVSGNVNAGHHITLWDASSASTGIYMVRMESTTGFKTVRKVMLVK